MRLPKYLITLCALNFLPASAIPITWDSPTGTFIPSPFAFGPTVNQQSNGSDMDETFFFACGSFVAGFDPRTEPQSTWAANFVELGVSRYLADDSRFSADRDLDSNEAPFEVGGQAYIWGFNIDPATQQSTEWILLTKSDWTWPLSTASAGGDLGLFSVSDDEGIEAILGTLTVAESLTEPLMTSTAVTAGQAIPQISYEEWVRAYFPSNNSTASGRNDDRDSDGLTNFEEYLAGFDPLAEQLSGQVLPTFQLSRVTTTEGTFFEGSIRRSPLASLNWLIEESTTLQNDSWSDLKTSGMVIVDSPSELRVRPSISVEDDMGPGRFFRLQIAPR